ncbi:ATP-binding protein [Streptomyces sp. SB3404]|uniref:ATP-binding protein n=1 Tax=Streptomyces boncukensis TaxID=2711219 RepID=A0A6G4X8L8_9ACTN|nr:ATP-binding protein [Streptomyces boncukensis]
MARLTLRAVLTRHHLAPLLDTAELLASELLTNAYLHSNGPASVRLRWTDGTLRIGVWDTNAAPPCAQDTGTGSESGRGMRVVELCAATWGWFALGDELFGICGKYVWCDLQFRPGEFATAA